MLYVIRKRLKLKSEQAMFFFINNRLLSQGNLISEIQEKHKLNELSKSFSQNFKIFLFD